MHLTYILSKSLFKLLTDQNQFSFFQQKYHSPTSFNSQPIPCAVLICWHSKTIAIAPPWNSLRSKVVAPHNSVPCNITLLQTTRQHSTHHPLNFTAIHCPDSVKFKVSNSNCKVTISPFVLLYGCPVLFSCLPLVVPTWMDILIVLMQQPPFNKIRPGYIIHPD